jgi:hypothetical protein
MKEFIAVVSHDAGMITKYQDFDTQAEADAHVASYGGKVVTGIDGDFAYWDVSGVPVKDTDTQDADNLARGWEDIRTKRDIKLAESDWTQYNDSPLDDETKDDWSTYRQALRDLPANTADPTDVTWPTTPS